MAKIINVLECKKCKHQFIEKDISEWHQAKFNYPCPECRHFASSGTYQKRAIPEDSVNDNLCHDCIAVSVPFETRYGMLLKKTGNDKDF